MMSVAAFCLAYAGFAALCLGMDRHYEAVFDRQLPRRHRAPLQVVGWLALALSLCASAAVWGWRYGTVEWIGILSLAGLLLIWFVSYRPGAALATGGLCAIAAPVLAWM
ncbi:DUF3325 domain-containing protein [Bordetella petrii]|uniref:DUF3325 domain-containing protein n=1 Tax=Bordetella petrii TaxID=94624 RepID=A0ABT7VYJ7_9BORD|nr:DUF3325 domain-containing protein [Bordetella petrii]MDM9558016.1 DUF3325 domain-containing protein [Bordetella petrii]